MTVVSVEQTIVTKKNKWLIGWRHRERRKEYKKEKTGRHIKEPLGKKSGQCPEALKTVLHLEPKHISEVLKMNPQTRERRKQKKVSQI